MARKDLPYLPLYVQDFLTDEKLMECSASATGVYIRIMCVLHKCVPYGKILLKQKDKQKEKQIENFALKFAKHFPYDLPTILHGLEELLNEECLQIEGDFLVQKRMFDDGSLSTTRSKSGSEGGKTTQKNRKIFALAKNEANADIEIDNDINKYSITSNKVKIGEKNEKNFSGDSRAQSENLLLRRINEGEAKIRRNGQENNSV